MRTIALKMKNYAVSANIVNNNNLEKRALNIILFAFGALAFLYVLFLGNMVWNIVARNSAESLTRSLSAEVGNLELNYLSLSNKVDLNLASSLGFTEAKPSFATRQSLGSLAFKKNEI